MDTPSIGAAAGILGGIALGALFTALYAGLLALGEVRLLAAQEDGGPLSKVASRVLDDWGVIRARVLVGRVLSLCLTILLAAAVGQQSPEPLWGALWVGGALFFYVALSQVASTVAERRASRTALRLLRWSRPAELLMVPFALPVVWAGKLTERLVPELRDEDAERIGELAVEHMIDEGEEAGALDEDQAEMLRSVLEFQNTVAREIMVPRTRTVAFDIETPLEEVLACIVASGHSRYPVYRGQIDRVEGILYAKDLFAVFGEGRAVNESSLSKLIRQPAFFVPETQKIEAILGEMQANRFHLAIVVDEFGGASGLVTLEDILEEIVGEIQDEHDEELPEAREISPGHYTVDAAIDLEALEDILEEEIPRVVEGRYETLGGMIVQLAGRVPEPGCRVQAGPWDFTVIDADGRHVKRVEIWRRISRVDEGDAGDVGDEPNDEAVA